MKKKKLLIVVDNDWFFLSHRLPIALECLQLGFEVVIVSKDTGRRRIIEEYGLRFIHVNFERRGLNPITELKIVLSLAKIYKQEKPDIVHHVSMKLIMNGILAAKLAGVKKIVNAVTGLGSYFISDKKSLPVNLLFSPILNWGRNMHAAVYIFQNEDDKGFFVNRKWVKTSNCFLIQGSGVDLEKFAYTEEPESGSIKILTATRLIMDKGINELFEAAKNIKATYKNEDIEFILAGKFVYDNPSRIDERDINKWVEAGVINYVGHKEDMASLIKDSHINVLPSYAEGLPKSLIEACAIGRPIVTTNVSGCRDVVDDNVNGILVPSKAIKELEDAIVRLISNKALRVQMGKEGRAKAERLFGVNSIVKNTIEVYEKVLSL